MPHPRPYSSPAYEPTLPVADRKAHGVYYTPAEIAEQIVGWTLEPWLEGRQAANKGLRILDPSCGAGEFLIAAYRRLAITAGKEVARSALWGIDIDESAVAVARARLRSLDSAFPIEQIIAADALCRSAAAAASFDAIVGNPPYINIRQLAKALSSEQIETLRETYTTARGNFDLYVLFVERAIELLKPDGRCGLIIPGKLATLDYARTCRELLLSQTTIERVVDLSDSRAFVKASVYPHILVFQKTMAGAAHAVQIASSASCQPSVISQSNLNASAFQFSAPLDIESRIETAKIGELATITCGTAGYAAQKIARRIVDQSPETTENDRHQLDFITSGNIDRYLIQLGNVRYLNQHYARPQLAITAPELTAAKRKLFASQKIVVAGMSRRLEAAWDQTGLALGVQVFAIHDSHIAPFFLLALLNSKLLSYLFATRFAAKRLGGGYLAVNKGQLAQLPIPVITQQADSGQFQLLSSLARDWSPANDELIDQLVYQIYQLKDGEINRVEGHFGGVVARAA